MKAIVLTYAPVTKQESKLLKKTNIFKIACNNYCAEMKPNVRLCVDNIVDKCLNCDTCPVISKNYDLDKERVINACYLPKRNTTLISCIDYLYLKGYTSVLLVATNPVSATYKLNIEGINSLKDCLYLYKYSKDGNLDIPYKSIKDFIMQTDEDKLLGTVETEEKKLLKKTIFTDACQYEVHTEGRDNYSIESGKVIGSFLSIEDKKKLLEGAEEITSGGLVIKRIVKLIPEATPKEKTVKTTKKRVK